MDLRVVKGGIPFPNLTGKLRVLGKEGSTLSLCFFLTNQNYPLMELTQHPDPEKKLSSLAQ